MSFFDSEFSGLAFGDLRLDKRFKRVIDAMMKSPAKSLKAACQGWAEVMGSYRLFNNKNITLDFDENEWRGGLAVSQRCGNPNDLEEPSLGDMIKIVAKFGGYLGRKHDGPPGAQAMWVGLTRVRDFAIALDVYNHPA